jgi:hypothetical protein
MYVWMYVHMLGIEGRRLGVCDSGVDERLLGMDGWRIGIYEVILGEEEGRVLGIEGKS